MRFYRDNGIGGVDAGFAAIVGLGAYTSAILSNTSPVIIIQTGISPWISMFAGAAVAGLVGLGLGVLTLRLRGIYAAVMAWFSVASTRLSTPPALASRPSVPSTTSSASRC